MVRAGVSDLCTSISGSSCTLFPFTEAESDAELDYALQILVLNVFPSFHFPLFIPTHSFSALQSAVRAVHLLWPSL